MLVVFIVVLVLLLLVLVVVVVVVVIVVVVAVVVVVAIVVVVVLLKKFIYLLVRKFVLGPKYVLAVTFYNTKLILQSTIPLTKLRHVSGIWHLQFPVRDFAVMQLSDCNISLCNMSLGGRQRQ